jgi:hypothetical protein
MKYIIQLDKKSKKDHLIVLEPDEKEGLLKFVRRQLEEHLNGAIVIEKNGKESSIVDLETHIHSVVEAARSIVDRDDFCNWFDIIPENIPKGSGSVGHSNIPFAIFKRMMKEVIPKSAIYVFYEEELAQRHDKFIRGMFPGTTAGNSLQHLSVDHKEVVMNGELLDIIRTDSPEVEEIGSEPS